MKSTRIALLAALLLMLAACTDGDTTDPLNSAKSDTWTNLAELEVSSLSVANRTAEVDNLSGRRGSVRNFRLNVPAGTTDLAFTTFGGTGDVDLYVRLGQQPTGRSFDCRSIGPDNNESCEFEAPEAGQYFVTLFGASAYRGVTLQANFDESGTLIPSRTRTQLQNLTPHPTRNQSLTPRLTRTQPPIPTQPPILRLKAASISNLCLVLT